MSIYDKSTCIEYVFDCTPLGDSCLLDGDDSGQLTYVMLGITSVGMYQPKVLIRPLLYLVQLLAYLKITYIDREGGTDSFQLKKKECW